MSKPKAPVRAHWCLVRHELKSLARAETTLSKVCWSTLRFGQKLIGVFAISVAFGAAAESPRRLNLYSARRRTIFGVERSGNKSVNSDLRCLPSGRGVGLTVDRFIGERTKIAGVMRDPKRTGVR